MELVLNELSLHGQFTCVADFESAVDNIMNIKQLKPELHCHRNLRDGTVLVTHDLSLQQSVNQFKLEKKRAFMSWITTKGPFWEESRQHSPDDWLESQNDIVTDTGLGEVAYRRFKGSNYQTFSFEGSKWDIDSINVDWHCNGQVKSIDVINHWKIKERLIADLLNDYQPDKSNLPTLNKPLPNLKLSNEFVDLAKFRADLNSHSHEGKLALIQSIADRIAKLNGYKFNPNLSTSNQIKSKSYRKIYESICENGKKIYLSVDFEKGAFELCNHEGEHQGEIKFDGEKSGIAQLNHNIFINL
ncbi:hypothetical protein [Methylomonas albis]|uniref:Uncharacterized protein n=1 Tax=Methylomonas albis TaxID=1854563 RepID=A0ABR9D760_9GAMM|nr:hypothetical protein [Methylomonas albis]MBD9358928.1 hypothetical protein [Methylomonas albis]MBD9358954.1 hypothetical protein [Methylomonas albis]CAD6882449.1 hypothetical protein [Methylomonas albis]